MFSPNRSVLRTAASLFLVLGLSQSQGVFADGPAYTATAAYPPSAACGAPACAAPAACCAPTTCAAPAACCPCPQPPDICTCTTFRPVCETTYHQQPVVGYHDVCRTCYRQEPYCVTVPVTKVDCVRVDEGCYKMVWCPKIVTKQIPRTEFHQQVCSRTVPYTVTQRVPHVTNVCVPECRTRYVPHTRTFLKPPCPTCVPCPCPPTPGCGAPVSIGANEGGQGYSTQSMAAAPGGTPQSMTPVQPSVEQPATMPARMVAPLAGEQAIASTNVPSVNGYTQAAAASNVWQASRGIAAR